MEENEYHIRDQREHLPYNPYLFEYLFGNIGNYWEDRYRG